MVAHFVLVEVDNNGWDGFGTSAETPGGTFRLGNPTRTVDRCLNGEHYRLTTARVPGRLTYAGLRYVIR